MENKEWVFHEKHDFWWTKPSSDEGEVRCNYNPVLMTEDPKTCTHEKTHYDYVSNNKSLTFSQELHCSKCHGRIFQ